MLDFSLILPGLAVGSMPPTGCDVRHAGFDTLVLTADEYQPPDEAFCGVAVYRVLLEDKHGSVPSLVDYSFAEDLSKHLADRIRRGANVLVTCIEGRNRSTFITALTMRRLTGKDGGFVYDWIRDRRPHVPGKPDRQTFTNKHLRGYLLAKRPVRLLKRR
jgi:protein-tyrosine phosphatase